MLLIIDMSAPVGEPIKGDGSFFSIDFGQGCYRRVAVPSEFLSDSSLCCEVEQKLLPLLINEDTPITVTYYDKCQSAEFACELHHRHNQNILTIRYTESTSDEDNLHQCRGFYLRHCKAELENWKSTFHTGIQIFMICLTAVICFGLYCFLDRIGSKDGVSTLLLNYLEPYQPDYLEPFQSVVINDNHGIINIYQQPQTEYVVVVSSPYVVIERSGGYYRIRTSVGEELVSSLDSMTAYKLKIRFDSDTRYQIVSRSFVEIDDSYLELGSMESGTFIESITTMEGEAVFIFKTVHNELVKFKNVNVQDYDGSDTVTLIKIIIDSCEYYLWNGYYSMI